MGQFGYWNKILAREPRRPQHLGRGAGDAFFRRYVGGRGLIAHYLLKYVRQGRRSLGPDNILVIAPGVVTGAPVPGGRPPQRGRQVAAQRRVRRVRVGWLLGRRAEARRLGRHRLPRCLPQPVYLWINDGAVEFRDAAHLWGRITGDVEEAILDELGDRHQGGADRPRRREPRALRLHRQ